MSGYVHGWLVVVSEDWKIPKQPTGPLIGTKAGNELHSQIWDLDGLGIFTDHFQRFLRSQFTD